MLRVLILLTLLCSVSLLQAGEVVDAAIPETRYGLFDGLDHRSAYGQDRFPETFRVDDSDLETGELRLNWQHTKGLNHQSSDVVTGELEKSWGIVTLELEVPFEYDRAPGQIVEGMANVNIGGRLPVYEYVSPDGLINSTFGTALELGIPTNSAVSKNTELVPKIFNDLMLGKYFTLQSVLGYSMLYGSGSVQTFEYGFTFGYTIPRKTLSLPGVLQLVPIIELTGQTEINKEAAGHNSLTGDVGIRCNLKAIGPIQPRPGIAFVFPIDNGGREQMKWGLMLSLVFEY